MSDSIKRIYLGLPENIASKVLWVERKFRINELSHQPGGFDIIVEYYSGNVFGYDWIKSPGYYTNKILANEAHEADMDYDYQHERTVLAASKKFIRAAYCKYYNEKNEAKNVPFEKVWDVTTSNISVVEALKKYEEDIIFFNSQSSSHEEDENVRLLLGKHYPEGETPYYDIARMYESSEKNAKALEFYEKAIAFHRAIYEKYNKENPWRERIRNSKLYSKDSAWHTKLWNRIRSLQETINYLEAINRPF